MRFPYWWTLLGLAYPAWRALQEVGFEVFFVQDFYVRQAVMHYLYEVCTPIKLGSKAYGGRILGQGEDSIAEAWEGIGQFERCFLLPNNIPVWAMNQGTDTGPGNSHGLQVRYLRFLVDPDVLLKDALLYAEKQRAKETFTRYEFCTVSGTGHTQHGTEVALKSSFDILDGRRILWQPERRQASGRLELPDLPFTQDQQEVTQEIQRWSESKAWYKKRKIPWRRGYLLHGPPGTGKTTFVQAIARHLDVKLVSFDLATFDNVQFPKVWRSWTQGGQPQVILLEDLDAVFNGRQNIKEGVTHDDSGSSSWHLSWDCLLSVLDGVEVSEGVLLFVTTNRPERLDSSLATVRDGKTEVRPGRIDRAVYFGPLTEHGRLSVASRLLQDDARAREITKDMHNATVADIQEACVHEALQEFWSQKEELQA